MGVVFRTPQKLCLTQLDRHKQQRKRFLKNKKKMKLVIFLHVFVMAKLIIPHSIFVIT